MDKHTHIIQKQILEIQTGGIVPDYRFQEGLRQWYYTALLPRMEELFDRYGHDRVIRMESCQLAISVTEEKGWMDKLSREILLELELILRQHDKPPHPDQQRGDAHPAAGAGQEETLLSFIETGMLPWHASGTTLSYLEESITRSGDLSSFRYQLLGLISASETCLQRAVLQLSGGFLERLFSSGAAYRQEHAVSWKGSPGSEPGGSSFWEAVLSAEAGDGREHHSAAKTDPGDPSLPPENKPGGKRSAAQKQPEVDTVAVSGDGWYLDNAGLILLHPFLRTFFEGTGLYRENRFIDPPAHGRAVLLTQYMVTGENRIPEHELLLNKILCGYPVSGTLPPTLECSDIETAEVNELLMTVIENWKRQGTQVNTTKSNLRASFLQRPGKLIRRDQDWLLQVELRGYDIVLNSLPWGIGLIRYHWMKDFLRVNWI